MCTRDAQEQQAQTSLKDVHCHDWKTLAEKGELDTLKVPKWDKYIEHKTQQERKENRQNRANHSTVHYYETSKESTFPSSVSVGEDSDESDNDIDLVLCDGSESESDDDSHTVTIQEGTSTRSGCRVGTLVHKVC